MSRDSRGWENQNAISSDICGCRAIDGSWTSRQQQAAKAAFDAEMMRDGKDCPNAANTIELNECLAKALEVTEKNFGDYYASLRSLLLDPANPQLVDSPQKAWTNYRELACGAIYKFYEQGTIRASQLLSCKITITRSRMRELNSLYATPLHH